MAKCRDISPTKRRLCAGALRQRVDLYARALAAPAHGSQDNQQEYTLVETLPAAVQTTNGIDIFDGVEKGGPDGVPATATVLFFVRHRTDVTAENFIVYDGVNYEVLRVEDIDLRREYLKIFAAPRGQFSKEAAK